jgi:HEAT repeat protein
MLVVGSLITAMAGTSALTGWLLWPEWQRYSALRRLEQAGRARDEEKFLDAVETIGQLPADERLVSDLVERVKDRDAGVRAYSILTLAVLKPRPVSVVPLLIAKLDDPDEDDSVRAAAAAALRPFGNDAAPAIPSLVKAAKNPKNRNSCLYFAAKSTVWAVGFGNESLDELGKHEGFVSIGPNPEVPAHQYAHFLLLEVWPDLPHPMNPRLIAPSAEAF